MPGEPSTLNKGYIPDDFDGRDKQYFYCGDKVPGSFSKVNLWEDSEAWLSNVYNQYGSQSCVANATAAAVRFLAHKVAHEKQMPSFGTDPSRLFIYYNARAMSYMDSQKDGKSWPPWAKVEDTGTMIRSAMKAVNRFGIATEKAWPFVAQGDAVLGVNDRPADAAYAEAGAVRALEYCRLDPDTNYDLMGGTLAREYRHAVSVITLARLKQCLVEGYPVVFAFSLYWNSPPWVEPPSGSKELPALPEMPDEWRDKPQPGGGHAVLAVGFEDDGKGGGRVLCQNSYGESQHHFWMSYSWIHEYYATSDFWMIRSISSPKHGASTLTVPSASRWTLDRDAPDGGSVLPGRGATVATASFGTADKSFGMWWVAADGSVQGASHRQPHPPTDATTTGGPGGGVTSRWRRYQLAGPGSATPGGGIAAVAARLPTDGKKQQRVDVFWVAADGSVKGAAKVHGEWSDPYEIAGGGWVAPGSPLAAICRSGDAANVAWVARDASVQMATRLEGAKPDASWAIVPFTDASAAGHTSGLALVSFEPLQMTAFFTAADGIVRGRTWHSPASGTDGFGPVFTVSAGEEAVRSSRLAAVAHSDGTADVFYISVSGFLRRRSGPLERPGDQWTPSPALDEYSVAVETGARSDSDIRVVASSPPPAEQSSSSSSSGSGSNMDVVWVARDNALMHASGVQGKLFRVEEVLPLGSVEALSPLGAVSAAPGRLSVSFRSYEGELVLAELAAA